LAHADLQALHAGAVGERRLAGGLARAVVGVGKNLDAGLLAEAVDHFLEDFALAVGQQVVAVAEDERVVGDAQARVAARGERRAADDHVHRAELHALVDVGLLAER
jgi:hypothetical protein